MGSNFCEGMDVDLETNHGKDSYVLVETALGKEICSAQALLLQHQGAVTIRRPLMGTVISMTVVPSKTFSSDDCEKILEEAWLRAEEFAARASFFAADSELSRLNKSTLGVPVGVSDTLFPVLVAAQELAELSEGVFDACLGRLTRLRRHYARRNMLPPVDELEDAQKNSGYRFVRLDKKNKTLTRLCEGVLVDLGGIAKGACLDNIAMYLKKKGCSQFLLSTTSDILAGEPPFSQKYWYAMVSSEFIGLRRQALSTAGGLYQNQCIEGRYYTHIIDVKTGLGSSRAGACSVVAPTALYADGGATTIFLDEGKESALKPLGINVLKNYHRS